MAIGELNHPNIWLIIVHSKQNLSESDKDLIVSLVDAEAHSHKSSPIILHDAFESTRHSRLIVEGTNGDILDLVGSLESNPEHRIKYVRLENA